MAASCPAVAVFGLELFSLLVAASQDENVFISPLSIATCLAMVSAGVSQPALASAFSSVLGNASSAEGAAALRKVGTPSDARVVLQSANSLWARAGIKDSYSALVAERFGAQTAVRLIRQTS